jgi:hypothetical protein
MGYYVRKTRSGGWRLQLISYAKGTIRTQNIPPHRLAEHDFTPSMSIEEASKLKEAKNKAIDARRHAQKRENITRRLETETAIIGAAFPLELLREFETDVLRPGTKTKYTWLITKRMLAAVNTDPLHWAERSHKFYEYCITESYSYSYFQKLVAHANEWGKFVCKRRGLFWDPIPLPTGHYRDRIQTAHEKKGKPTESDPLTPEELESKRSELLPKQYNWLKISIWFGLRPYEIERLHEPPGPKTWSITTIAGVPVLKVYQTKLVGAKTEKRTKVIPCLEPEQREALELVRARDHERPLAKTLKRVFANFRKQFGVKLYAGRKGFIALMVGRRGHKFQNVSAWLGHQTMDRTYRDYMDKQKKTWD